MYLYFPATMPLISAMLIFCLSTFTSAQFTALKEGDVCSGATGDGPKLVCTAWQNCTVAVKLVEDLKPPPSNLLCGFQGSAPLVCCPPDDASEWPKTVEEPAKKPTNPSKAAAKCEEYRKLYRPSEQSTRPANKNLSNADAEMCAPGREKAGPGEFPHMVLLGFGDPLTYACGGSLISEKFVLTAGLCGKNPRYGPVRKVLLGHFDDNTSTQLFDVVRQYVHENYDGSLIYNDIMLLELDRKVTFNDHIKPICLHTEEKLPFERGIVSGWGPKISKENRTLEKIETPLVGTDGCNEFYKSLLGSTQLPLGVLGQIQLCAGDEKGQDSCVGDAGGPLQVPLENGLHNQVGIVSAGKRDAPGLYTRVSAYVPWIESIVWPN